MYKTTRSRMVLVLLLIAAVTDVSYPAPPEGKGGGKDKDGSSDPPSTPSIRYAITLLGTLGGSFSWGAGVNNAGHVVGTSGTASTEPFDEVHAFVYNSSTGICDLDALCHQDPSDPANDPNPGGILVTASDINGAGQIIGQGYVDDDRDGQLDRWVAFLYTPGNATSPPVVEELVGLGGAGDNPRPMAINEDGDVAGHSVAPDGLWHAVLWTAEGQVHELDSLAGHVCAVTSRDGDGFLQVAGTIGTVDGRRAWRWTGNTLGQGEMIDLGHFEVTKRREPRVEAFDMNELGQVVGFSSISRSGAHAFRYSDEVGLEDLGGIDGEGSDAQGVNLWGETVGFATILIDGYRTSVPFIFSDEFGMVELEPLIVDLPASLSGKIDPWRINDAGQICGPYGGNYNNPDEQAFLLTPIP